MSPRSAPQSLHTPFGDAAHRAKIARMEFRIARLNQITRRIVIVGFLLALAVLLADAALSTALALPDIAAGAVARAAW